MGGQPKGIRERVGRDRVRARIFGLLASMPARLVAAIFLLGAISELLSLELSAFAFFAFFSFLFETVGRWSDNAVRAAITPQRVRAMWLRRFQAEGGRSFRVSRVIDRLTRHGVRALTLQDRDVQLSWEQRRTRYAPRFWLLFLPIGVVIGYFVFGMFDDLAREFMDTPSGLNPLEAFGHALVMMIVGPMFAAIFVVIFFFFSILALNAMVMFITVLSGPIGAIFTRHRDDFRKLPRLLQRIKAGRGRGAVVIRVSDAKWRDAVHSALAAVDVAIIDLTNASDQIIWELGEAAKACGADGLIFIRRQDAGLESAVERHLIKLLGHSPSLIIGYPGTRDIDRHTADGFAQNLREAIYVAAERRHAS